MREKGMWGSWRGEGWRGHGGGERQMEGGESKSLLAHADLTRCLKRFQSLFPSGSHTTLARSKTKSQQS